MKIIDAFLLLAVTLIGDSGDAWDHMGNWAWPMMGFVWLLGLLVIGLVAWLVATAVRDRSTSQPGRRTALEILEDRYARGEIDRDEYLLRREDLLA